MFLSFDDRNSEKSLKFFPRLNIFNTDDIMNFVCSAVYQIWNQEVISNIIKYLYLENFVWDDSYMVSVR